MCIEMNNEFSYTYESASSLCVVFAQSIYNFFIRKSQKRLLAEGLKNYTSYVHFSGHKNEISYLVELDL